MDNLIAEQKAPPFIIVMTYGMTNEIQFGGLRDFAIRHFETVLVDELIPYIDANFRTLSDQSHRAMAGLSMGGMETKMITLRNLDMFSHIGLFSGGLISLDDVNNTPGFKEKVKLVFVSYGSKEVGGGNRGGRQHQAVIPRRVTTRFRKLASTVTITCLLRRPTSGSRGGEASVNLRRCCSKSRPLRRLPRDLPRPARRSPRPRRRLFASMPAGSRPLPIRRAKSGRQITASKEATRSIVIRTR